MLLCFCFYVSLMFLYPFYFVVCWVDGYTRVHDSSGQIYFMIFHVVRILGTMSFFTCYIVGLRPFSCDSCDSSFPDAAAMRRHKEIVHDRKYTLSPSLR